MNRDGWSTVTRSTPCPICGKPDWCRIADKDGNVNCMRIPSTVQVKNGGWLHVLNPSTERARAPQPRRMAQEATYTPPEYDAPFWWRLVRRTTSLEKLRQHAEATNVPVRCLDWLGAATFQDMLCFPMHDGHGKICGIRTRKADGSKRAITGSRAGVFLSTLFEPADDVLVVEGPTDAAAALALGYEVIGRPSCTGCEQHVVDTARRLGVDRLTVVADNDGPGIAGSRHLAEILIAARITVRLVAPAGHKDLRAWLAAGATRVLVDAQWQHQEWRTT